MIWYKCLYIHIEVFIWAQIYCGLPKFHSFLLISLYPRVRCHCRPPSSYFSTSHSCNLNAYRTIIKSTLFVQRQCRQRARNVMRGQHLPRVGRDAAAGGRVGRRLRDVTLALAPAPPARHAPPQASLHATSQAYEVSILYILYYVTRSQNDD